MEGAVEHLLMPRVAAQQTGVAPVILVHALLDALHQLALQDEHQLEIVVIVGRPGAHLAHGQLRGAQISRPQLAGGDLLAVAALREHLKGPGQGNQILSIPAHDIDQCGIRHIIASGLCFGYMIAQFCGQVKRNRAGCPTAQTDAPKPRPGASVFQNRLTSQ